MTSTVRFNIDALLDLFDRNMGAAPHTSAIKAMLGEELPFALLEHYFASQKLVVTRPPGRPGTGTHRGHRLDGWIATQQGRDPMVCYQVEVKFWSIHGVMGGALPQHPGQDDGDYRCALWSTYWVAGRFREASLDKVLDQMQLPAGWHTIRALACLWSPAHPDGFAEPFFEVSNVSQTPPTPFKSVWVFSASSYLRSLKASRPAIELKLPEFKRRQELLSDLFS